MKKIFYALSVSSALISMPLCAQLTKPQQTRVYTALKQLKKEHQNFFAGLDTNPQGVLHAVFGKLERPPGMTAKEVLSFVYGARAHGMKLPYAQYEASGKKIQASIRQLFQEKENTEHALLQEKEIIAHAAKIKHRKEATEKKRVTRELHEAMQIPYKG